MYITIAMAGEGKRFVDFGFNETKFKLIANGRPLFDWALDSLKVFYDKATFIFISRRGFDAFIMERCKVLNIHSYKIVTLEYQTDGQATTVLKGIESEDENMPLLIYNIDTHIKPDVLMENDIKEEYDGWLLLFSAPGDHWSFARLDSKGRVVEVSEKSRISEYASTGLYYFKSIALFKNAYFSTSESIKTIYKETYVAPLYSNLIKNGKFIASRVINFNDLIPLGTPYEVLKFDADFFSRYRISR